MAHTDGQPRIYYERRGQADRPALVLIRGLGRTARHWPAEMLEALAQHFSLLLLDNRGVGRSGPVMVRRLSTALMAADVARVMDASGLARAHVFGMSLGGMVAQRLALDHPERVDGLVLGCTTCGGAGMERAGLSVWSGLLRARLQALVSGSPRVAIAAEADLQLSPDYRHAHPQVIDDWQALAEQMPVPAATMVAHVWAAANHRSGAELDRIRQRTLVLSSNADRLIPPSNSVHLARAIAGAQLAWIEGAGHDFVTEAPERSAALMRRFLLDEAAPNGFGLDGSTAPRGS